MVALTPTLEDKYYKKFFDLLAKELEEQFPKKKCKERGQALVLNGYANIFFRQLIQEFEQEIIKNYDRKK